MRILTDSDSVQSLRPSCELAIRDEVCLHLLFVLLLINETNPLEQALIFLVPLFGYAVTLQHTPDKTQRRTE